MLPYSDMSSNYSDSPVVFVALPQSHFPPHHHHIQAPKSHWMPVPSLQSRATAPPERPALVPNPSRKRSRDEFDEFSSQGTDVADEGGIASMDVVDEPIMGEGMTLIDPSTGRALAAESQTGTWYEDQLEEERRAAADAAAALEQEMLDAKGRPSKTVRLDSPAPGAVDTVAAQPLATTPAPSIDSASIMLGIGWKEVSSDADMQSAARGWARYIEKHYPMLGSVEILCKSDGHEAFLAKAAHLQESYWLFKEDLSEGKLVATNLPTCIDNLRAQPMVFESNSSIFAATSICSTNEPAAIASIPQSELETSKNFSAVAAGPSDTTMFD